MANGNDAIAVVRNFFDNCINKHDVEAGEDTRPAEARPPAPLPPPANEERLATVKQHHARAYEKWTQAEDTDLLSLHATGSPSSTSRAL